MFLIMPDRSKWSKEKRRQESRKYTLQAKEKKIALKVRMGSVCEFCGDSDLDNLQFDHPNGKDWQPRDYGPMRRIRQYERDYEAGNLRLLCTSCNAGYRPPGYGLYFGPEVIDGGPLPVKPDDGIPI